MKIMIIEDDFTIANSIKNELSKWNYEVFVCKNFSNIIDDFKAQNPNLLLLDINLPEVNGYYICSQIRKISDIPVIFISALSDKSDVLSAMQMGADDYIVKPIDLTITVAKIRALLKRTYEIKKDFDTLIYKELCLNISKSNISYKKRSIDLTFTELQIITELIKNPENFISKSNLIEKCWKNEQFIDDNTLMVNINRLRKKFSSIGLDKLIETKKNIGYRIYI